MTRSSGSRRRPEANGYGPRADRYDRGADRFATGYGRGGERTNARGEERRYGRGDDPRYEDQARRGGGGGPPGGGPNIQLNVATVAVLAGVLVIGIGIGSAVTSTTQGNQGNIASAQQLDMAVPDPEFCKQWGASAFVMDIELYTTMNPSSSFVTQPTLQPGCVIRRENWSVLQKEGAVTSEQMRQCKQRMNTFAYIGSVRDKPVVRCVYQTDISGNKFQTRGIAGAADDAVGITPEADQF